MNPIKLSSLFIAFVFAFASPAHASRPAQTEPNEFTFQQLRLGPITLTGPLGNAVVSFGLPAHWAVNDNAQLRLSFSTASPGFQESGANATATRQAGNLKVSLNDTILATVPLNTNDPRTVSIDIPARAFTAIQSGSAQSLSFQLEDLEQCGKNDQTRIVIQPDSAFVVPHQVAPVQRDLRLLPYPLLQRSYTPDAATLVVPNQPSAPELQAALNVAAGLGRMTHGALALTLVTASALDETTRNTTHLILIGKPAAMPLLNELKLPLALSGAGFDAATPDNGVLQMAESPWNPQKVVLVVSAATDAGVALAGKALGSGNVRASKLNDLAIISGEPAAQAPTANVLAVLDTPLANLGYTETQLRGKGRQVASYTFSLPEGQASTAGPYFQASYVHSALIDDRRSSLTVLLNGSKVGSLPLDENSTRLSQVQVVLPKDSLRPGENYIRLEAEAQHKGVCAPKAEDDLWISVRPDSVLHMPLVAMDATQPNAAQRHVNLAGHLSALLSQPNLSNQLFVVGPDDVLGWNLAAQLAFGVGAQQNWPGANPTVMDVAAAFSNALPEAATQTRDVIAVGQATALPGVIDALNAALPAPFPAKNDVAVERDASLQYRAPEGADMGYVQLAHSPWNSARSLLAVMGSTDVGLANAVNALLQAEKRAQVFGNLVFINGEQIVAKDSQPVASSASSGNAATAITRTAGDDGVRQPAQPALVPGETGAAPTWLVPVIAVSVGVLLLILAVAAIMSVGRRRPPCG